MNLAKRERSRVSLLQRCNRDQRIGRPYRLDSPRASVSTTRCSIGA
jgi:hypothetical protein